ncbi:MAG TPA: chromate efflux transporter [Thermohalobaculum sp.]|nr:chromate efflux transporter [Thermohalobaculum sp.]
MSEAIPSERPEPSSQPGFAEALKIHVKIGLLSFGGPAGQIALMQQEIVERRGWVAPRAFDRGLAFSMMLPGPEAQQLATWLGWRLHGTAGGLAAGLAFILPGAALMIVLAWLAAAKGHIPLVAAVFAGVQPVVIALVLGAMLKIGRRALKGPAHWVLAGAAFVGLFALGLPFPLIVALAGIAGLAIAKDEPGPPAEAGAGLWRHFALVAGISVALIAAVFVLVAMTLGTEPYRDVAELFTTAALVTFGGAYAVLPFVADSAVEHYHWLDAAQMLNGLAIAEATPGPLILVNTYAGFFAGWSASGTGAAGALTAALATFYTFAPSFMLILAFAPAVERIQNVAWARRALAGVSAAVVGVILNLAIYLAEAAFFPAGLAEPEIAKLALFAVALVMVFRLHTGMLALVGFGVASGLVLGLLGWI